MWTGAVISPGTYFLTHPAQIRCCTPFANIRTRKNPWIADRYGKSGVNSTKIKNAEKINSNARNIQKGILNRYHFLWNPVESSSIEWASWVTRLMRKNCSSNSISSNPFRVHSFYHFSVLESSLKQGYFSAHFPKLLAEAVGFEPTNPFGCTLSKRVH